jgi:hypothetical protein
MRTGDDPQQVPRTGQGRSTTGSLHPYGDDAEFGRRMPRCSGRRGGWLLLLWGVPGGDEADGGDAAGVVPMIATPATGRLVAMTHGPGRSPTESPG